MKKYLTAAADAMVWIVTGTLMALVLLLLVVAGAIMSLPVPALIAIYSAAAVVALVLLIGWLAKPVQYEVRDKTLTIVRSWPFTSVVIDRSDIREVRSMKLRSIAPSSVVVLGVFGYAGRFKSDEVGSFAFYGTSTRDTVLISAKKDYVVSPANPKRFMHDLLGKR